MKIYTSITLDWDSGGVIAETFHDYDGPVALCKGGDGGAGQARADEQARQEKIRSGTEQINSLFDGQFNDDFYGARKQSYLDYAMPQLKDQYDDATKQLIFSLDRAGLTDSSMRAEKLSELQKLYDTNTRAVADTGLNYENNARNNVESARSGLISQLNSTADVAGAINSANSRAAALSASDSYSPLGQLFATFTSALGSKMAADRTAALTGGSTGSTNLFGTNNSAVKTSW